jgi:cbb3-type cytochrome c oxidase subunit III
MQSQSREKNDPQELNNPIPYSVSALILGLTLWAVSYIFWTSHTVEEANEVKQYAQTSSQATVESTANAKPIVKSATSPVAKKSLAKVDGKAIYSAKCSACHQSTGKGLPGVFPPLDNSKWVTTANHELPVQIIAKGLMGKITVAGGDYNGVMPAFGQSLSNAELAALVTYLRGAWSNKSTAVSAEDVATSLAKHSEQSSPWTGETQLVELVGSPK